MFSATFPDWKIVTQEERTEPFCVPGMQKLAISTFSLKKYKCMAYLIQWEKKNEDQKIKGLLHKKNYLIFKLPAVVVFCVWWNALLPLSLISGVLARSRVGRNGLLCLTRLYTKGIHLQPIPKSPAIKMVLCNLQATPASQRPASASLKTNLLFWVRKYCSPPSPNATLQERFRDPFADQQRANSNIEIELP